MACDFLDCARIVENFHFSTQLYIYCRFENKYHNIEGQFVANAHQAETSLFVSSPGWTVRPSLLNCENENLVFALVDEAAD